MFHKKYNWTVFIPQADEWLVAYSLPPALHFVKLFIVGHAVELYLKAVVTKQTGDIALAIKQGHKIKKLWDLCKQDSAFMPEYEIRQSVLDVGLFAPEGISFSSLSEDYHKHYDQNAELYVVAGLLPDLKYWSTPSDKFPDGFRVPGWLFPNPYWIGFFKGPKSYLGPLPNQLPGQEDYIKDIISWDKLPKESRSYLAGLYE